MGWKTEELDDNLNLLNYNNKQESMGDIVSSNGYKREFTCKNTSMIIVKGFYDKRRSEANGMPE